MGNRYQRKQIFLILILLTLVSLTIISCQSKRKFDRTKWLEVGDLMTFPNRNSMVQNLVESYNLKGKSLINIISLLGQPQYPLDSTMNIGYKIDEEYGSDINPVYTKTLLIEFDKDSLIKNVKIEEWKK